MISPANCAPFSTMAASTPPLLSDRMAVISLVRWLTALAISSALPTKLRATSSLTPVSVRSASLALVRIASVVESASAPSERSASAELTLIAWLSCSMRECSASAAALVRVSI